jgi:hypothetical protein
LTFSATLLLPSFDAAQSAGENRVDYEELTDNITAVLLPRGNVLQYRIRNDDERHEQVMAEDMPPGPTLMWRTFGHE